MKNIILILALLGLTITTPALADSSWGVPDDTEVQTTLNQEPARLKHAKPIDVKELERLNDMPPVPSPSGTLLDLYSGVEQKPPPAKVNTTIQSDSHTPVKVEPDTASRADTTAKAIDRDPTKQQNNNPVCSIEHPKSGKRINPGNYVAFKAEASDPDNDNLSYNWIFEGGSPDKRKSSHGYTTARWITLGAFTTTLTVTDGKGGGCIDTVAINVQRKSVTSDPGVFTLDFETGKTNGWVKTGTAFEFQPSYGDNPTARHRGQPSRHEGNYWIGTYEKYQGHDSEIPGSVQGDGPKGTLTSKLFTVPSGSLSFLVGGGGGSQTRVELLVSGQKVLHESGRNTESMHRVEWDLNPWAGQQGQIRLVDNASGGWGHINADDFKFSGAVPSQSGQVSKSTTYLGCYKEKGHKEKVVPTLQSRDINMYTFKSNQMTMKLCTKFCVNKGLKYAAMQYANQCFCDNSYGQFDKADNCNMPCTGNKNEICGGAWANSVYQLKEIGED